MAKHTLVKWAVGLSSVLAFTSFVGFSRQADTLKESEQGKIAAAQTQTSAPAVSQLTDALNKIPESTPKLEAKASPESHVQTYPKKEKQYSNKKHKEDDDDHEYKDRDNQKKDEYQKKKQVYSQSKQVKKTSARSRAS